MGSGIPGEAHDHAPEARHDHARRRLSPYAMRGWYAAMGEASTSVVDIVAVGDSITEGGYYTGLVATGLAALVGQRPPHQMVLGSPDAGAFRFSSDGTENATASVGGRGCDLADGDECVYDTGLHACDGFRLFLVKQRGGGDALITIDGATVDTVSTDGEGLVDWTSSALTWGVHTVAVEASGGAVIVAGAIPMTGNRTTGFFLHNAGHMGWRAQDFLANTGTFDHISHLQPALVIIFLGLNSKDEDLAAFTSNFRHLVAEVKAARPSSSVLIVAPYRCDGAVDWQAKVDAQRDVAAAENCGFLDLYELMGNLAGAEDTNWPEGHPQRAADPFDLSRDGVHLTDKGCRLVADAVLDAIQPNWHRAVPVLTDGTRPVDSALTVQSPNARVRIDANSVLGASFGAYRSNGDARPAAAVSSTHGFLLGAGGSPPPDISMVRAAAGTLALVDPSTSEGVGLGMVARVAPSAPSPGRGILYLSEDGEWCVVDPSGAAKPLRPRVSRLTHDFSVTASNTAPESCGLAVRIRANEVMAVDAFLLASAASAPPAIVLRFAVPSGATGKVSVDGGAGPVAHAHAPHRPGYGIDDTIDVGLGDELSIIRVHAIVVNRSVAGEVGLLAARAAPPADAVTIHDGSTVVGTVL